jgi:hypothetical protein
MIPYNKMQKPDYPRDQDEWAHPDLSPKLGPLLSLEQVREAVQIAFERAKKTKKGKGYKFVSFHCD